MVSHHYFGYFAKLSKQTNETKGVDNLYLERTQVHFLVFEKCTYFQILDLWLSQLAYLSKFMQK